MTDVNLSGHPAKNTLKFSLKKKNLYLYFCLKLIWLSYWLILAVFDGLCDF